MTTPIIEVLNNHTWPGNVRELSGFMERLAIISRNATISEVEVEAMLRSETTSEEAFASAKISDPINSGKNEREIIVTALKQNNGHQGRTAKQLDMHRSTLQRKMKTLGIRLHRLPL